MAKPTGLAKLAVKALEDLKGIDIKLIDVAKQTAITDWWIICTGTSNRHVRSLAEYVVTKAKEAGEQPRGIQGLEKSEWVLVDLGSVVVHVLQVQARAHYQLEKLMPDLPPPAPRAAKPKAKPKSKSTSKTKAKAKPPKRKTAARKPAPASRKPAKKRKK